MNPFAILVLYDFGLGQIYIVYLWIYFEWLFFVLFPLLVQSIRQIPVHHWLIFFVKSCSKITVQQSYWWQSINFCIQFLEGVAFLKLFQSLTSLHKIGNLFGYVECWDGFYDECIRVYVQVYVMKELHGNFRCQHWTQANLSNLYISALKIKEILSIIIFIKMNKPKRLPF